MTDAAAFLKTERAEGGGALAVAIGAGLARGALAVAFAWLLSGAIDRAVFHGARVAALLPSLETLVGLVVFRAFLLYVGERAGFKASARVRAALFHKLLDHIRALGPVRLADRPTGELVATLTDAVAALDPYWRRYIPAVAAGAALPLFVLFCIAFADWRSALVFVIGAPVALLFLYLVGQGAERAADRQWASLTRLGGYLLDAIQGLPDLKIFRASKKEIVLVAKMADAYRRDAMAVLRLAFLSSLALEFFTALAIALVAVLVGFRLLWGEVGFHVGLFVLLLAPEFYAPFRVLGVERHAKMEASAAAERIVALLDRVAPQKPQAPLPPARACAVALRFDNVHVVYDGGARALDGIDLDILAGEHVALVGPSGAGKSTLFSLLLGFIQPSAGQVFVDGAPLAGFDPAAWRERIAYLPQRLHFFDGDVAENIAMGRAAPEGDAQAAIARALKEARAGAVVARLPAGAKTPVGESGYGLSGGEAQRIALARAFYRPAPLVLLDEPAAHLDPATENDLKDSFARLAAGRTMIVIAHRLATAQSADRLIVLDHGRIVETGRHEDLIAAGGFYARMVAAERETAR